MGGSTPRARRLLSGLQWHATAARAASRLSAQGRGQPNTDELVGRPPKMSWALRTASMGCLPFRTANWFSLPLGTWWPQGHPRAERQRIPTVVRKAPTSQGRESAASAALQLPSAAGAAAGAVQGRTASRTPRRVQDMCTQRSGQPTTTTRPYSAQAVAPSVLRKRSCVPAQPDCHLPHLT